MESLDLFDGVDGVDGDNDSLVGFSDSSIKVSLDHQGLHIVSDDVFEKLERKNISPSLITSLEKCSAKWFAEAFVLPDIVPVPIDNAGRRGSLFHKIMEDFFALPAEDRTKKKLQNITNYVLSSDEFKDLGKIADAQVWLKTAIRNYYDMGAKPENVVVADVVDDKGAKKPGLEIFVKGNIGGTKRDVLGYIDRLVVDTRRDNGAVFIEDWKTGKVHRWNPNTKSDEGLGEARQQIIYKMLLEQQGLKVSGARLIFPLYKEIINVDIKDERFANRVVDDIVNADKQLDIMTDNNTFEFNPSYLCAWCPLSKICPVANIKPYNRMKEAFETQPEPEILAKGIDFH